MASFATVNPNRCVLIEERSPFIGVALHTRLLVLQARIDKVRTPAHFPGRSICTVWIVAIRTRHESLVHSVFKRLRKLRPNIVMATVANVGLPFGEEVPVGLGLVDRMAGGTNDIRLRVVAAADIGAVQVFGMTPETGIEDLIRRQIGECDDSLLSTFRVDVFLTRSVTTLAPGILYWNTGGDIRLVVWISKELECDIRVTSPACAAARIA